MSTTGPACFGSRARGRAARPRSTIRTWGPQVAQVATACSGVAHATALVARSPAICRVIRRIAAPLSDNISVTHGMIAAARRRENGEGYGISMGILAHDHGQDYKSLARTYLLNPASTEGVGAPAAQGARRENTGPYLTDEQRRATGCPGGRMPAGL